MNHQRWTTRILWAVVILSPILSILIMCAVTNTSLIHLDAWNTTWNDENGYYCTIRQMRMHGAPMGVVGYNEVAAQRPSYGPYSPFVYIPYYLGSLLTGLADHNYMYYINIALSLIATASFVALTRPKRLTSTLVAVFFVFQFIITRYIVSGMTEASYLIFSAVLAGCVTWAARTIAAKSTQKTPCAQFDTPHSQPTTETTVPSKRTVTLVFLLMICVICFWGMMRPYLLVYIVIPCTLLLACDFGTSRKMRYALVVLAAILSIATLLGYLYFSKYYVTPYFYTASIANSMMERILSAAASFVPTNIAAITYSAKLLLGAEWGGIMAFMFALLWFTLLAFAVQAAHKRERQRFALIIAILFSGFIVYEANILLYSYMQLHRTLIATNVFLMLTVISLSTDGYRQSKKLQMAPAFIAGTIAVLCAVCLVVNTEEFALPQTSAQTDEVTIEKHISELKDVIKQSDTAWDNTVAHPVESENILLYYTLPSYASLNCCQKDYLHDAIRKKTLKSKYLCLPDNHGLNKSARKRFAVAYVGLGHVLYRVR